MTLFDLTPEQFNTLGFIVALSINNTYTTDELDVVKNFFVCLQGNLAILLAQRRYIEVQNEAQTQTQSETTVSSTTTEEK